jgi:hypothetical protein
MAKLRDAEAARTQHAESLRKLGAHAIEVAQVGKKSNYEVIAHFAKDPPKTVPTQLQVKNAGKTANVRLQAKKSPRFTLE